MLPAFLVLFRWSLRCCVCVQLVEAKPRLEQRFHQRDFFFLSGADLYFSQEQTVTVPLVWAIFLTSILIS